MIIKVELIDDSLLDSYSDLEQFSKTIQNKLKSALGLSVKIKLVPPMTGLKGKLVKYTITETYSFLGIEFRRDIYE